MERYSILIIFLVAGLLFSGCSEGFKKTANEPLHAESGIGITIWKVPALGIGTWGGAGILSSQRVPALIIRPYDYTQETPPPTPPGAPPPPVIPSPSEEAPSATSPSTSSATESRSIPYPTVYSAAPFDDPTLLVVLNRTPHEMKFWINNELPLPLPPYGSTADIRLAIGTHMMAGVLVRKTAMGDMDIPFDCGFFEVRPGGRATVIRITGISYSERGSCRIEQKSLRQYR